mmetsp:Transcript_40454/g.79751  ORF Transcript_40454/g.79751 Transcript_40454/m.79751 type:complete len:230 (+) Transcript_40454:1058-1747(+)
MNPPILSKLLAVMEVMFSFSSIRKSPKTSRRLGRLRGPVGKLLSEHSLRISTDAAMTVSESSSKLVQLMWIGSSSHTAPVKLVPTQLHEKESRPVLEHVPPFWHGFGLQGPDRRSFFCSFLSKSPERTAPNFVSELFPNFRGRSRPSNFKSAEGNSKVFPISPNFSKIPFRSSSGSLLSLDAAHDTGLQVMQAIQKRTTLRRDRFPFIFELVNSVTRVSESSELEETCS